MAKSTVGKVRPNNKPIQEKAGVVVYRSAPVGGIEILLITSRQQPPFWIFPAGKLEAGESLQQAAVRECAEESGYIIEIEGESLGLLEFEAKAFHVQSTFFLGKAVGEHAHYEQDRQRKWVKSSELLNSVKNWFRPVAEAALQRLLGSYQD